MELKSRLKSGCRVGPYETVRLLGVGYSGEVHEAVHAFTGQRVALKCLHSEHMESEHKVSRFSAEATALFKLGHANVVRVLDAGWDGDSHPWMAMELLTGHTLGELLLRQGRLSPRLALQYALDIAWGIDAAHENGVIHRDLKPDNVFVVAGSGAIKVLDFSAAKFLTSDLRTTKPPEMTCTLAYASPELLEGQQADARIDIYALGLMLWQMLAGEHPYEDVLGKQHALITAHFRRLPTALAEVAGEPAFAFLDALLRPALAKSLAHRYATMAQLAQAIMEAQLHLEAEIAAGNLVIDVPPGEPPPPQDLNVRKLYQAPESALRQDTEPAPPVSRVTLATRPLGPLGTIPLPLAEVEAAVLAARAAMPSIMRSLTPIEAESHRPTLPRRAPAAGNAPAAARARVTVHGLVVLAALLAMGNVTWWLRQRPAPVRLTRPPRATAPAAAPTALPSTMLAPEPPEPPEPTAAPTLRAPVVLLAKTAAPASKPISAPRPKPTASGPRPLFEFPSEREKK